MPVELKDVVEKLGLGIEITDDTTIEDIDKAVGEKFIDKTLHETQVKAAVGKRVGSAETKIRQLIGDEGKGKTFDELMEMLPNSISAKIKAKEEEIEALKESGKSTGKEAEELAELRKQMKQKDELVRLANEEKDKALTEKEKAILTAKEEAEEKETKRLVIDIFNSIKWVDDIKVYTKKGLFSDEIDGKYLFKPDGNGDADVFKADGETMELDGTKQMKASKLFEKIADKADLLKKNGSVGSKKEAETKIDMSKIDSTFIKNNLTKAEAKAKQLEEAEKKK